MWGYYDKGFGGVGDEEGRSHFEERAAIVVAQGDIEHSGPTVHGEDTGRRGVSVPRGDKSWAVREA